MAYYTLGTGLLAVSDDQVIVGKYNTMPGSNVFFAIGAGTENERKTAFRIEQSSGSFVCVFTGEAIFDGSLTVQNLNMSFADTPLDKRIQNALTMLK